MSLMIAVAQCLTYCKQRSYVNVEAHVSKPRRNHFASTIMSILPHLCHEDAWSPTLICNKLLANKQKRLSSFLQAYSTIGL